MNAYNIDGYKSEKGLLTFTTGKQIYQTFLIYDKKAHGSSNTSDLCSFVIKWREENVSILYPQSIATLLVKDTYKKKKKIKNFDLYDSTEI